MFEKPRRQESVEEIAKRVDQKSGIVKTKEEVKEERRKSLETGPEQE